MERIVSLGEWLRRRRKALDLTQDALAALVGCSKELIAKIEQESRRPSQQVAALLATHLHLSDTERPLLVRVLRAELAADNLPDPLVGLSLPTLVVGTPRFPQANDFPALKSLAVRTTNLPAQVNPLIGRTRELMELMELLGQPYVRQITLNGPGGTGKTRLVLQVGAALNHQYADGVWFVDLAPVSDSTQISTAIAQALGIPEASERPIHAGIVGWLRERRVLLILDNCEQVVEAVAHLVADLLRSTSNLQILATSRIPLRIVAEHEYAVAPLSVPDLRGLPPFDQLSQYDAVALFLTRARAVQGNFTITASNAPTVAEICVRLDGLPLAIELAAAHLRLFSPEQMLDRLVSARLQTLIGGARDLPARQQTMRATITWSYQLLTPSHQVLLGRLAVFVGGWTLAAAEEVCGDPVIDVLEGLDELVAQSLVRGQESADAARYTLLETIREFAAEQLHIHGELERLQRQHAFWFATWCADQSAQLWGHNQVEALAALWHEYDNIQAALTWLLAHDSDRGVQMITHLSWFWYWTSYRKEGVLAAQHMLSAPSLPALQRANLLWVLALLTYDGASAPALEWMQESLALMRTVGSEKQLADLLLVFVQIENGIGQSHNDASLHLEECRAYYIRADDKLGLARCLIFDGTLESWAHSLELLRAVGHQRGIADVLVHLGRYQHHQHNHRQAQTVLLEARTIYSDLRDIGGEVWILLGLGDTAQGLDELDAAITYYRRAAQFGDLIGDLNASAWAIMNMGEAFARQGRPADAIPQLRTAITHFALSRYNLGLDMSVLAASYLAWSQGEILLAARLLYALDQDYRKHEGPFITRVATEHSRFFTYTQQLIGAALTDDTVFSGEPLPFATALAEAQRYAQLL
jgi:predicted ATPase/transcriptional regulator with XRE-family HTH domain